MANDTYEDVRRFGGLMPSAEALVTRVLDEPHSPHATKTAHEWRRLGLVAEVCSLVMFNSSNEDYGADVFWVVTDRDGMKAWLAARALAGKEAADGLCF